MNIEEGATRRNERISLALHRPIPDDIVARSHGMLEQALVRAAISERVTQIAAEQELTPERWVKELRSIAFSNIGDYRATDDFGQPTYSLDHCTPEQMAAVKSLDIEEYCNEMNRPHKRKIKLVMHDKLAALDRLGRYMGMQDSENPHWKQQVDRTLVAFDGETTTDEASDAYADYLNG